MFNSPIGRNLGNFNSTSSYLIYGRPPYNDREPEFSNSQNAAISLFVVKRFQFEAMPFNPTTCHNPRLVEDFLTIECRCQNGQFRDSSLNLTTILGVVNGRFKWGGRGFFSHARNTSLAGSALSAELKNGDRWEFDTVDLSAHIRDNDGVLEVFGVTMDSPGVGPPPAFPKAPNASQTSSTTTRTTRFSSSSSESRSSYYFKKTVSADKLRLQESVLHAECRKADGSLASSTIDLDEYIGVVSGKLVWGRKRFRSKCTNIRLEEYTIKVECRDEETHSSVTADLDLTRYLQVYDGILGVKVAEASNAELSNLFSEARWMKLKVVTEPDASVVVKNPAFKAAFSSLAELTSKHVVTEMSEDLEKSVAMEIKEAMGDKIKAQVTKVVAEALSEQVRSEMERKVEESFAVAKKAVIEACNQVVDAAVNNVTIQCTESIIGPMTDEILAKCDAAVSSTVKEVTDTAISHFQERVEILMEREIASAALRRARTEATFLKLMAEAQSGLEFFFDNWNAFMPYLEYEIDFYGLAIPTARSDGVGLSFIETDNDKATELEKHTREKEVEYSKSSWHAMKKICSKNAMKNVFHSLDNNDKPVLSLITNILEEIVVQQKTVHADYRAVLGLTKNDPEAKFLKKFVIFVEELILTSNYSHSLNISMTSLMFKFKLLTGILQQNR
ncbi:hypothetical protein K435DRAFT_905117 [Dendrothele bispora CBS 962.96]|uniref:Cyanovirin-N domain-containing protein n=1 Tax=Dendrothele bispora (strain CBS 962.96) TaxID=1314807 RepID=A0A4S8LTM5_DENBC|nr:hypothetical protein K435DRAFT_905117 [Dendrothele bispora CBS 962.96]